METVLLLAILLYCVIKQWWQKCHGGSRDFFQHRKEQTVSQALLWYICCWSFPAFGPMFVFVMQQSVQWINLCDISVVGGGLALTCDQADFCVSLDVFFCLPDVLCLPSVLLSPLPQFLCKIYRFRQQITCSHLCTWVCLLHRLCYLLFKLSSSQPFPLQNHLWRRSLAVSRRESEGENEFFKPNPEGCTDRRMKLSERSTK